MKHVLFTQLTLLLLLVGRLSARQGSGSPVSGSDTVIVSGLVEHELRISAGGAAGLSLRTTPAHDMRNAKGALKKQIPPGTAYLLKDILGKALPVVSEHKDEGKYLVVVTAADGYTVVFSYNELQYGAAGSATWLMPVSGIEALRGDGPFVVISMSDPVSAPRYVKWVKSIEVRKI